MSLFCVCAFEECLKSKKWKQHSREKHIFISEKKENIFWQNLTQKLKLKRANIFSQARQTKPELKKGKVEQQKVLNQKGWKIGNTILKMSLSTKKSFFYHRSSIKGEKLVKSWLYSRIIRNWWNGVVTIQSGLFRKESDNAKGSLAKSRNKSFVEKRIQLFSTSFDFWGVWQDFLSFGLDRI